MRKVVKNHILFTPKTKNKKFYRFFMEVICVYVISNEINDYLEKQATVWRTIDWRFELNSGDD